MRNEIEKKVYKEKIKDLKALPGLIEKTLLHDNDIQTISTQTSNVVDMAVQANYHLESASGKKFKITPLMIGGAFGALITLPVTLGTAAGGAIVGYAAAAGGVLGAVAGKKLA